jgi:hypothetical protein
LSVLERRLAISGKELLVKRCHHCGGRFGLIRHRHFTLQFCTARCLEIWKRGRSDRARQYRFLEWLLARNEARGVLNRIQRRG